MHDLTFELTIRILPIAPSSVTKDSILGRLAEIGITQVVEGVVNGISEALPETDGETDLFDVLGSRYAPMLVYADDRAVLENVKADLFYRFPSAVELTIVPLANAAWQSAWEESDVDIRTEKFLITGADGTRVPGSHTWHLPLRSEKGFGDGRHAATHVLLTLLERIPAKESLLDCGTGTGILAIAASFLGYQRVVATEIDSEVLKEAEGNAHSLGIRNISWSLSPAPPHGPYDVIVANILAPVLHDLMPFFAANLTSKGTLLVSGFIDKEKGPLVSCAEAFGLRVVEETATRHWLAIAFEK